MCSAASTASPSSLGLVKVRLLPTHSPAPPFQTQLPHSWTAAKKTPNAMLLEKLLAKPISAPLGINQSQLLLPGFRMVGITASAPLGHAGASRESLSTARPPMPQPATTPPIGSINRCHSLRLLLLSYLNHRPRPRWERRATAMTLGSRAMTQPRTKG